MPTIIVSGPQGCGKTTVSASLARRLGCTEIVDDWDGRSRLPVNSLALTSEPISSLSRYNQARTISFHEALSRL